MKFWWLFFLGLRFVWWWCLGVICCTHNFQQCCGGCSHKLCQQVEWTRGEVRVPKSIPSQKQVSHPRFVSKCLVYNAVDLIFGLLFCLFVFLKNTKVNFYHKLSRWCFKFVHCLPIRNLIHPFIILKLYEFYNFLPFFDLWLQVKRLLKFLKFGKF